MLYALARRLMRIVFSMTLRVRANGIPATRDHSGYILACSHVSHLDPFCLGTFWPHRIGWMARIEFFRARWAGSALRAVHAFPVHRQGVPLSAIRGALARLAHGEVVGLFPEGEIKTGADSVLRGGPIKRGICLLAARSGKPVLPCIIAGTEKLNAPGPWMPFLRGRLWIFCGDFIQPVQHTDRRAARIEMAARIERAFVELYARMRREFALEESIVP